VKIGISPSLKL